MPKTWDFQEYVQDVQGQNWVIFSPEIFCKQTSLGDNRSFGNARSILSRCWLNHCHDFGLTSDTTMARLAHTFIAKGNEYEGIRLACQFCRKSLSRARCIPIVTSCSLVAPVIEKHRCPLFFLEHTVLFQQEEHDVNIFKYN
jgi:hypothetical protein